MNTSEVRSFVLCVAGPSGSGKTSLCDQLALKLPFAKRSISFTTRPQRPGENAGGDYHFVTKAEFEKMRDEGKFLETAEVFGNLYGTPLEPVEEALQAGQVMIMDVDTVGADAVKKKLTGRCVRVFIMPPSMEELERRLRTRQQNNSEDLERRLAEARREMKEGESYEYVVENRDFDEAFDQLRYIVDRERISPSHKS